MWAFGGCRWAELSVAGPALLLFLFLGVSIDLMEVRQLKRRGDEYRKYIAEVPCFLPVACGLPTFALGVGVGVGVAMNVY